jgi:hypothetical protein
MKISYPILLLLLLVILTNCEKTGSGSFQNEAVVEAYIVPSHKITVKISKKVPYDNEADTSVVDINHLSVRILINGTSYSLIPTGSGTYSDTSGTIKPEAGNTIGLWLMYNNTIVSSSTIIPSKPVGIAQSATSISMEQIDPDNTTFNRPPDPVEISFSNDEEDYYMAVVECMESIKTPIYKDSVPENGIYATRPTSESSIDIQPMMLKFFGRNRIVLYHINKEYTTFLNTQVNTTQNYQDPPTNIENGLGIFTAMNTDTIFLQVNRKSKIQQKLTR